EETKRFIDNTTRLSTNYNLYNGFTAGIGDLDITEELYKRIYQVFETKKLEVCHEITEVENNPDMMDEELFERSIKQKLDIIRDDISKLIMTNLKSNNGFKIMIESGAKGKSIQVGQMAGCVGQQDFQGGRILKNYNNRSLPHFFKNDDRSEARGFVKNSFLQGLTLTEFIFHQLTGREGLIDQTIKTAESGYIQRKLIKAAEDFMVKYDGTVRNAVERIQQFIYGDSGIDTVRQYDYKFKLMEFSNSEISAKYKFTPTELTDLKNYTESDNTKYYKKMLKLRDNLRSTQIKASLNYLTLNINYTLPVNLNRIIDNSRNNNKTEKKDINYEPEYIIKIIKNILKADKCRLYSMTEDEIKDPKAVKNQDDVISKTAFKYALYDILAPKRCITEYKFSKPQLDEINTQIISSFNRAVVEPGEMVGILGAQSLGEPVTQLTLNSFHNSGVGGMGAVNLGVPRIKEVISLSSNPKEPVMYIYMDTAHHNNKDYASKIASHIKFTTIKDLRNKIEIFYDPNPTSPSGFMEQDNVYNIFYTFQQSKTPCLNKIDGLPWLMRIEFDKEKLLTKEVSLLDIKSQFCTAWEKRYQDIKSLKREKRQILEKITQLAVLTNTENDTIPTMHVRFDMTNFSSATLIDFMDAFIDDFKLKGISDIEDIRGGNPTEERMISFNPSDGTFEKKNTEYVIYTKGINMIAIRDIIGVDLNRTFCNDIITTYEIFGIEAARNLIIRDLATVFASNGSTINHQHISIFADLMTNVGTLTSIDRHGLNKLDTDPLSRASFEKTVDQLITAAIFNEVDHMKSVSSRIMAGLCIKGGTGLCNLILDKDLLENSEHTTDIGQLYNKTYEDIVPIQYKQEIDTDVFIPDM
ncbi:MAG: DNA-directed RNA polymerase subunit alpha, partial [Gaeavirus sp.]